jgi:hypothetical protein
MSSAVLVHTNGFGSVLFSVMSVLMAATSSAVLVKAPCSGHRRLSSAKQHATGFGAGRAGRRDVRVKARTHDRQSCTSLVLRVFRRLALPRLAGDAGLCHAGGHPPPGERATALKKTDPAQPDAPYLIRRPVQAIRRSTVRSAQRRIQPAHGIPWSFWQRAHQAGAHLSNLKRKMQL